MFLCTIQNAPHRESGFVQPGVTAAMSVVVDVGLLSGKTVSVEAGLDESVGSLNGSGKEPTSRFLRKIA